MGGKSSNNDVNEESTRARAPAHTLSQNGPRVKLASVCVSLLSLGFFKPTRHRYHTLPSQPPSDMKHSSFEMADIRAIHEAVAHCPPHLPSGRDAQHPGLTQKLTAQ